ncbi:zeste-white 10 kinetochore protein [Brevipalpus obovatus]|uniref:zeste-white 10 kinetochore protein n=1 Tax=Brevipalpus obovatus TaxID=246614 RepID=UPI003D9DC6DD
MDILTEWLSDSKSNNDVGSLIDRFSQEIADLEAQIRTQLKLKQNEKYPYVLKDFSLFLGDTNVKLSDIDVRIRSVEEESLQKTNQLRDLLLLKKEKIEQAKVKREAQEKEIKQVKEEEVEISENLEFLNAELLSDELVANYQAMDKLARHYLVEARSLMKQDLFPTIDVGTSDTFPDQSSVSTVDQGLFSFPKCKISESIYNLVKLMQKILTEVTQSSNNENYLLFQATRNIGELYLLSLQTIHQSLVKEYHQYSAICHNNCMFVAHHFMTFSSLYGFNGDEQRVATFVDMVPALKEAAYNCIQERLRKDRQIILDLVRDPTIGDSISSGIFEGNRSKSLVPLEKALKMSLSHIKTVKESWYNILPHSVCNKLIATLVNYLISGIVDTFVKLEDISADASNNLERIFEQATSDIENLMKDFHLQNHAVISRWLQFKELRIILQASLKDIVERWAEGHGPLAEAFSAENVKNLIRSLFQNTEHRSSALSKIK